MVERAQQLTTHTKKLQQDTQKAIAKIKITVLINNKAKTLTHRLIVRISVRWEDGTCNVLFLFFGINLDDTSDLLHNPTATDDNIHITP